MSPLNNDKRPLYLKIKEHLEEMIENKTYQPGDRLPSETTLSRELDVSRASLREALRVLEEEGKIVKHQGIGTFVREPTPKFERGIEELNSVTETIKNAGYRPGTCSLSVEKVETEESLKKKLKSETGRDISRVMRIERIRTADGIPVVYCLDNLILSYLNYDYNKEDFSGSLFNTLHNNEKIFIDYAVTRIIPVNAKKHVAKLLEIEEGEALLLLEQFHYDRNQRMILFSQNYFRSDQFQFRVLRRR